MKKVLLLAVLVLGTMGITLPAQAAPLKMIFFYPGGQGSQEQAQSLLDGFSEALKRNSGGKIEAEIHYFTHPSAGEAFIKNQKPVAGILAWDLFQSKGAGWQAKPLLKTLQLPSADGRDQYFILGPAGATLPTQGEVKLLSSRPLDASFINQELFPKLGLELSVQAEANIVGKLRKMGKGEWQGWVLLDQFEKTNISKLKTPWAKNLQVVQGSQKIPSAPFVIFEANIPPGSSEGLKKALLKLSRDKEASQTLGLLRIQGFSE